MKAEELRTVGVVGAGLMGSGIALNFALAGYDTVICDLSEVLLRGARQRIATVLQLFVDEELITQDRSDAASARIETTENVRELASRCDFVTEAIVERLADKQQLFRLLDEQCPHHTVIVSNTSGLKLSDIGDGVRRQEQLGLTHYFVPPHIVPGVEIARGPSTSEETFQLLYDLMKRIGKVPVRVLKERPGYLLNTIHNAMIWEAGRLWAEGVASAEDIERGVTSTIGFRMPFYGPFGHYDYSGTWRWPRDLLDTIRPQEPSATRAEAERMYLEQIKSGPWFMEAERVAEDEERRDRDFIRRLKALYPRRP